MKSKHIYWFLLGLTAIAVTSCKEIFEPNISNRNVTLEAPGNNYQSTKYAVSFWWDKVDDASGYRLQVVTPSLDTIGALVVDTLVKGNTFTMSLDPGRYQWHVRAENGSSKTAYSTGRSFTVLPSTITTQSVLLTSPANNALTNQSAINFQWGSMYGATKYRLEIDTNNFVNEAAVIYNQVTPAQLIAYTFPKDQTYQWRVRAENDTAQSKWSAINLIVYNHTPPGIVTLTAPANNQTVPLPVSLQWNSTSKAVKYKLYVLKSDSTTWYNQTFPLTLTTTSYSFNLGVSFDKVYWKVTAIDAAGNEGQPSVLRHFVIQ
ncbi:hypothetical protein BDD43_4709 [Mucilaginibacter gracilis]|uniref:Fibronectin type-III domain-containing protein n=1 Tax=Mucilaginibacter gracilis TaxID=423350 RepID=A0A495J6X3_9SPHI|nr:hypothetical protein [Mucilaginibacter gracilis]RKR84471.1 hypothetical protein BDD43_4709 [Mucilaginibacter gracilis]